MTKCILTCDARPLLFFIESFDRALKVAQRPLDLGDFTFELVRVDMNLSSASANEIEMTLYPSDAFLLVLRPQFVQGMSISALLRKSDMLISLIPLRDVLCCCVSPPIGEGACRRCL